ncbi:MAG TPA: PAS domain-containing protein [Vicinamibacterales bacterium]|jgi:hypothetical protein
MPESWSDLLMNDHQTTEKVFDAVERALTADRPSPATLRDAARYFQEYVDGCHNKKEEDHLFPLIEQRGIPRHGGPLAVMLSEHDQNRSLLPRFVALVDEYLTGNAAVIDELRAVFAQYAELLKGHFWKENDILYPMARRVMSNADAEAVVAGIAATEASVGPDTRAKYYALADRIINEGGIEDLSFGVERDVLAAILNTLPVELSFVDRDDRVRYFSHENGTKIFPRTRGAIGTAVQNCHPQKSVHLVNRILADFKAGTRQVAEFWIEMGGRMIHIRYVPVRNPGGEYLGTLEVVQDVTGIRALTGQRRLLDEA